MQETLGIKKAWWDWAAERVRPDQISNDGVGYSGVADPKNWAHLKLDAEGLITRPELANFSLGMVGGGKISGSALPFGESVEFNVVTLRAYVRHFLMPYLIQIIPGTSCLKARPSWMLELVSVCYPLLFPSTYSQMLLIDDSITHQAALFSNFFPRSRTSSLWFRIALKSLSKQRRLSGQRMAPSYLSPVKYPSRCTTSSSRTRSKAPMSIGYVVSCTSLFPLRHD